MPGTASRAWLAVPSSKCVRTSLLTFRSAPRMPSRKSAAAQQTIDFDRSVLPRYVQLATLFRGRIRSGDWSLNAQIPTVDDLSAQYAVALCPAGHFVSRPYPVRRLVAERAD